MTIPVDSIAVDNLRMAASQGEHDRVITDSKDICKQLLNLHLQTLDIQARSYVACARIAKALDIATTIQQTDPASALGYLCQGYIHTQQGRFLAAARVYDTALQHVSTDDPFYDRLQKDKEMALERSTRRMDLVARLPNDVSYSIFGLVFAGCRYEEYCQYLLVSSTWRQCIFHSDHLQVIIEDEVPFEKTNSVIVESFQHLRSIEYRTCGVPFYMLFKSPNYFNSLTSLFIEQSPLGKVDEAISTLCSIGSTLTTLILRDYSRLDQPLYLNDILKSCPRLVSLDCITDIRLSPLEATFPALLHLTLHPVIQLIDNNLLMDILPWLPSLRHLDLSNVPTSTPMGVINASCRSLQCLRYSDGKVSFRRRRIVSSPTHGLRELNISNTIHNYSLDNIQQLLISHHDTLETLFIDLRAGTSRSQSLYDVINKNDDIRFGNLTILYVKCMSNTRGDKLYLDMMTWVVQRAPFLKRVVLSRYAVYPPLMRAMAQCVCLKSLVTDSLMRFIPEDRPDDYDHVFAQFIKDHVDFLANRGGSRLQTLHVGMVKIEDTMVQAIGGLKCLKVLILGSCHSINTSFIPLFQTLSGGCHDLHTLYLRAGIYGQLTISNDILYLLHGFCNLQILHTVADLSEATIGALGLRQCPHLNHVVLHRSKLHKEVIKVLKETIQFVRCVEY
ncbi:hypothetical protein O0I10_006318 [Lichtheimia ornata]|uniref:F-box domain-containing protein n=1 Tax=Lichtheimia ornata TaxID=688661 RepID=A0AAD7V2U6_9FUNG|nr:uncharacterized protein O0I10_006318 [Lichtheimia ornata]KAJ8658047.1 hypothetical protein O0I10_006318 [Lichtheimia ornata]